MRCTGGWNDNNTGQSNTSIDLKFNADEVRALKDGIGKVHEDTSFATIQIAVLLDGKTAEEPLACDAVVPKSATGSVLAWRLLSGTCKSTSECVNVPVSPWSTVGRWEPPSSCDELKTALGVAKKNDGGKPMASATPAPSTRPR